MNNHNQCGKSYAPTGLNQKFCRNKCQHDNWRLENKEKVNRSTNKYYHSHKPKSQVKACEYCGDEFVPLKNNIKYCCEGCRVAKRRLKRAQYNKKYSKSNPEKESARFKRYREANKDKIKKYQEENREHIRENNKNWRLLNKEKIIERAKIYREEHREEVDKRIRDYYRRIYEECEQGVVRDALVSQIFSFLNNFPETSIKELVIKFYGFNHTTVRGYYYLWFNFTFEKSI